MYARSPVALKKTNESECKSLIPTNPKPGDRSGIARAIQKRFYSTIAIDYMDGSVNALPTRDATMTLTVQQADDKTVLVERSREMIDALKTAGGNPKYTEYPGVGHNSWAQTYSNPELYAWMFEQRKK